MARIDFVCPECGGDILVESQTVIEYCEVTHMELTGDSGVYVDYSGTLDTYPVGSAEAHYECFTCGFVVSSEVREAFKWLQERNMIKETKSCLK